MPSRLSDDGERNGGRVVKKVLAGLKKVAEGIDKYMEWAAGGPPGSRSAARHLAGLIPACFIPLVAIAYPTVHFLVWLKLG